jgi:Leucine-rich repeat (LRR) protein
MRAPFVAIILIVQSAVALFDIAQNVCDIGDKQLKCYMRTLQSDINQADVEAVSEAESLTVKCSDAFFYESTLRANHFGALPNLENLEVEYCKIRHMPARAFVGLSGLQRLAVKSHNSEWSSILMDVDRDTFVDLKNVRSLDLSHNNMWSLPLDSLCHMPKLTHLNMSRNHLLDVTDLGLNQLDGKCTVSLKELDVSRNFISSLRSNDLSQTSQSIERLSLRRNRLTFISDEALWSMSRLQVLDLADNQLAALPPAVFNKSGQLQELHLQNNSLTLVTPELFSGLSNLVLLNLSHNAISSHLLASDTFGGLVSLRVLDLSHNRLTKLDATIFNTLPKLEILILDHNRIHNIDSSLAGLTQLRSISLANNKIAIINEYSFAGLTNLTSINLSGNELTELATFGDSVMGSLEELSLSGNQLTTFPRAMLAQADSLKTLDLGENRIESIPDGVFANLQNLYALRLAGNDIALLSNATFGNMSGLHVLNMANNRLETIPQGTFGGLQQLRGLRLDNNALVDLNGIVASLGLLQWLNVSANGLEWFDYAFIPNSLEWLDISHNEISELGNFYRLQNFNLHTLEAGHNLISSIDESSVPARQLQYIQLRHNSIAKVATHTFAELAYLDTVDLRSNQIRSLAKESLRKSIQGNISNCYDSLLNNF